MKRHIFTRILSGAFLGSLFLCGVIFADFNISEYAVNFLSISSYRNSIEENYEKPDHVDPGQKVIKEVSIRNTGDVDSFVRVKIGKMFGTISEKGFFEEDKNLNPEMIQIHYNTDLWEYRQDGYWYYRDALKAGTSTKKPLMDSYYLSEKAGNSYKNKEARITVALESIQAESSEMKNIWGMTEKDLGITYQPCTCETVTSVTFKKEKKLEISGEKTDLFANFKNLTPGCSRSQTIHLENEADEEIVMFLRAQAVKQDKISYGKRELLRQLLTKYAMVEISEGTKVLYQGTVDGNLEGAGWSMKEDISLGKLKKGQGRNLLVRLSLDPEMDNKYQELLGKVKWVFSVRRDMGSGENEKKENLSSGDVQGGSDGMNAEDRVMAEVIASPKTGDETTVVGKWLLLFAALLFIALCSQKIYGRRRLK